jgi:hypothetical protein
MAKIVVTEAFDLGADVLLARGKINGDEIEARGWISAMENHYAPGDYDTIGLLKTTAKARKMNKAERIAYCEQLLAESSQQEPPRIKLDL